MEAAVKTEVPVIPHSSAKRGKEENPSSKRTGFSFNRNILYEYLRNPHRFPNSVVYEDQNCLVIKDAYPKAMIHLLLLPKESFLLKSSIKEFLFGDLSKVEVLHETAKRLSQKLSEAISSQDSKPADQPQHAEENSELKAWFVEEVRHKPTKEKIGRFLFGYHAVPSLYPLHLHIITDDFHSPALKTKKHWNSFTSEYFIKSETVEKILSEGKHFKTAMKEEEYYEGLLNSSSLHCHKCQQSFSTIPQLKNHLVSHF